MTEYIYLVAWKLVSVAFFERVYLPSYLRRILLRVFGAEIGEGVLIKSNVKVHKPNLLKIGDFCWIGQNVWFLNHAKITIGKNVCISQAVMIISSSHDYRSENLQYRHSEIMVSDGVWLCARCTILAGAVLQENSVVSAGEVFSGNLPKSHLYIKNVAREI